jgi:BirA family biotin operon repressor/biotin-[acetyl-CoA-carboxylase] ligase
MTLYYENDPADNSTPPQLPPLLRAVSVPVGQDVLAKAVALAAGSEVGTVFYSENVDRMEIAVRLAPEVPKSQAGQMLFAMMIGLGDSIGALAPPEVAVTYQLPGYIMLNRGRAGVVRLVLDPAAGDANDVPDWMIVSAVVRLTASENDHQNWLKNARFEQTTMEEEGGGFISRTRLVESSCRHFLVWVNRWQDDGFRPLYDSWMQRLEESTPIDFEGGEQAEWVGLDENGGALVKLDGKPLSVMPHELETICGSPVLP